MSYFVITRNGVLVGVTKENAYQFDLPDVSIHEFDGVIPDLNASTWDTVNEQLTEDPDTITKLGFMNRFTPQERIAIRASTDPVVIDIMSLLEVSEYVNVHDQTTINGVGYLALIGLIPSSRVPEILA